MEVKGGVTYNQMKILFIISNIHHDNLYQHVDPDFKDSFLRILDHILTFKKKRKVVECEYVCNDLDEAETTHLKRFLTFFNLPEKVLHKEVADFASSFKLSLTEKSKYTSKLTYLKRPEDFSYYEHFTSEDIELTSWLCTCFCLPNRLIFLYTS